MMALFRLIPLLFVLSHHQLDRLLFKRPYLCVLRFWKYLCPRYRTWSRNTPAPAKVRECLEALGPVFVKIGQMLSTRQDLLPEPFLKELAHLQDNASPYPSEQLIQHLEACYGQTLSDVFQDFNPTPLAAASIAQVHQATLHDGTLVAVKVLRPHIKRHILRDLKRLKPLAWMVKHGHPDGQRLRPLRLLKEWEHSLLDEVDLRKEAACAQVLARNLNNTPWVKVPNIHWTYTHDTVLVEEYLEGIRVTDTKALDEKGICRKTLAENGVKLFFTQLFRDGFFHADLHPGNLLVDPETHRFILLDFGITSTLSDTDRTYLAQNFRAFFKQDYRQVAQLHVDSGWLPKDTPVEAFEATLRSVCEPIFGVPLKQISCAQLLMRLFQSARRFNMTLQPQFILLHKTLFQIESIGRTLDPELDLWACARPFLEDWARTQSPFPKTLTQCLRCLPELLEKLIECLKR